MKIGRKQAAKLMNVSERSVYYAGRVLRSGRQDLFDACLRGEMSIHAALRIIDGPTPIDRYAALVRAWNQASVAECLRFLDVIGARPVQGDQ